MIVLSRILGRMFGVEFLLFSVLVVYLKRYGIMISIVLEISR